MNSAADVAAILQAAKTVGALKAEASAAPRILAALCDPHVTAAAVAQVVKHEPGLTGRVLRVANSAFYGLARTVSTIDRAVVVLGLDAVRGVAAAACLERALPAQLADASLLDPGALLRHSVGTAAAAEGLARVLDPALAGEAFIAGLLHDFGLMVQLRLDPSGINAMLTILRSQPATEVRHAEQGQVIVGHEHCAAVVFESWKLPPVLVEAVRHHHAPLAAPDEHRVMACVTYLADQLSLGSGLGFPLEPAPQPDARAVYEFLGVRQEQIEPVSAALVARTHELQKALAGA